MATDDFQERLKRIGAKSAGPTVPPVAEFEPEPEPQPKARGKTPPVNVGARISPTVALAGLAAIAAVGMAAALTFGKLTPESMAINKDAVKEEKLATPGKITDLFSAPAEEEAEAAPLSASLFASPFGGSAPSGPTASQFFAPAPEGWVVATLDDLRAPGGLEAFGAKVKDLKARMNSELADLHDIQVVRFTGLNGNAIIGFGGAPDPSIGRALYLGDDGGHLEGTLVTLAAANVLGPASEPAIWADKVERSMRHRIIEKGERKEIDRFELSGYTVIARRHETETFDPTPEALAESRLISAEIPLSPNAVLTVKGVTSYDRLAQILSSWDTGRMTAAAN